MKFVKLLLATTLFGFFSLNAFEKPEEASINPETESLKKDVDAIKAEGKLGPLATKGRAETTKRLADRFLALGQIQNRTAEQEAEFKAIRQELGSHMKALLPK